MWVGSSELLNLALFFTARTEAEVVKYWSLDPETAWRKESLYTTHTHTEAEGVKHLSLDPGTPSIYRQPELKRHEAGWFISQGKETFSSMLLQGWSQEAGEGLLTFSCFNCRTDCCLVDYVVVHQSSLIGLDGWASDLGDAITLALQMPLLLWHSDYLQG